jgi:phospholipid/cholesterol/gamma-HCH transport system ATP-binding protein
MATLSEPSHPVIELLEADIPSRREPDTVSVAGVNWSVRDGEFWVIGGLQGSGKSDLLCVAGAIARPLRGVYRAFGREITPAYTNECLTERLRLGLVFGDGGRLFNQLDVRSNISLPLEYHRRLEPTAMAARVRALLEATGLQPWAERVPSELNLAWRQRVALARALALRPEVLLLDNPLTGLDPRHARWWTEFISQLGTGHPLLEDRPLTVIVAADDLRPWHQPGRRFALLDNSRLTLLPADAAQSQQDVPPALRDLLSPSFLT